ncbi:MAG: MotA/TolQ/ExbB proton channel family protein [Sphingobacteriales bacterium]|jgi:biopolymer transport protein ExbB|nr:MotA/TolQ/ExbB proton channel family protein [Sphingobacteriales bacterium]
MNKVQTQKQESKFQSMFASFAIPVLVVVGICIYLFVLGSPSNFEGGDPKNHPIPDGVGHVLGLIYKGGFIVPILISLVLMSITFSIERFLTITKASGKGSAEAFVRKIQSQLSAGNIDGALAECDKQQGSVANVVKSVLHKYKEMSANKEMNTDQRVLAIQKELEESVSLELPMLEKNLVIIATMASVSTLIALLGTVLGMIKAFSALASAGSPDSVALANGISEALINTALGIGNSAIAIIMYNVFTTKIDKITYTIDEAGFSITQQFAASNK